jgi:hypothetical protein
MPTNTVYCQRCGAKRHVSETRRDRVSGLVACARGCPPHPEDVAIARMNERNGCPPPRAVRFLEPGQVRPEDL